MGTSWSVRLVDREHSDSDRQQTWQRQIQTQLDTVVAQMSHWRDDSNLGQFNRAPAGSWHVLPDAFFDVLTYALRVAADTDGAYDPAAGALINIWGFGPAERHDQPGFKLPDTQSIAAAQAASGWQRLLIETDTRRIWQPGGLLLDLSAVAKGYGVDSVVRYLESQGIANYLVEVGGELRGAGVKPDQLPWWVALESPTAAEPEQHVCASNLPETIVALHGLSIATSGDYRRVFEIGGTKFSHSIDPRSGYPIRNDIASVTVLHTSCMEADALSTALTVLGVDDGMSFAEQHRLAARFLVRTGTGFTERASSAFMAML
ncbi:MAG: thiamine biosynthesis protein ApbE [Verrucomicrobiaceae bacterium]|nr:thiamine biosynthesis protein ApbE [Verrucomicrobiaceae bacterium]